MLFLPSSCLLCLYLFFPLLFNSLFFSFTFSILLILSLSLLYSFHVVSLSAIARSLTVIVDIGSLEKDIKFELILFILALIPPALSVGIGSLEKELNLELILFLIDSDTSCSFFPLLPFSACIYSSLLFSTLLFLLYLLHPSDSFPFSSLLFSCSLFKCNCPKFNCNSHSWYRISFEKELNLELILFILTLIPPALSVGIGSLEKELNLELILFKIDSDTSCSFFPLLPFSACI